MVTEERIERAIRKVAAYVAVDPSFLPIFEKLESEREKIGSKKDALIRASAIVAISQNDIGESNLAA